MAGPASFGGDAAGHHEDAGADDGADAQRRQPDRPEDAAQAVLARHLGMQHLQGLRGKKLSPATLSLL